MKKKHQKGLMVTAFASIICFVLTILLAIIKVEYPYSYNAEIVYYSKKYEIEENLVRAIIKVESGYNELAVSRVGAKGLMQIMPATANWIARELDMVDYSENMLFNADTNIEFGCYYLNYLYKKYGNVHKVLFAYNAGEGVLNKYYSEDDVLVLDCIEIVETKEYIGRVEKVKSGYDKLIKVIS